MPQQTWEFRGTIEHPLFGDGLAKLDVGYDLINDLQDRVLICDDDGQRASTPPATSGPASAISPI